MSSFSNLQILLSDSACGHLTLILTSLFESNSYNNSICIQLTDQCHRHLIKLKKNITITTTAFTTAVRSIITASSISWCKAITITTLSIPIPWHLALMQMPIATPVKETCASSSSNLLVSASELISSRQKFRVFVKTLLPKTSWYFQPLLVHLIILSSLEIRCQAYPRKRGISPRKIRYL